MIKFAPLTLQDGIIISVLLIFIVLIKVKVLGIHKRLASNLLIGIVSGFIVLLMTSNSNWSSLVAIIIFIFLVAKLRRE